MLYIRIVKLKSIKLEIKSIALYFIIVWNYIYLDKYDVIFRLGTRTLFWFRCENIWEKEHISIATIIKFRVILMDTRTEKVIVNNLLKETGTIYRIILNLPFIVYISSW